MDASLKLELLQLWKGWAFGNCHFGKKTLSGMRAARTHYVGKDPGVSAKREFPPWWHLGRGINSSHSVFFFFFLGYQAAPLLPFYLFIYFGLFIFWELHPWHVEVPRLGVELEL